MRPEVSACAATAAGVAARTGVYGLPLRILGERKTTAEFEDMPPTLQFGYYMYMVSKTGEFRPFVI